MDVGKINFVSRQQSISIGGGYRHPTIFSWRVNRMRVKWMSSVGGCLKPNVDSDLPFEYAWSCVGCDYQR